MVLWSWAHLPHQSPQVILPSCPPFMENQCTWDNIVIRCFMCQNIFWCTFLVSRWSFGEDPAGGNEKNEKNANEHLWLNSLQDCLAFSLKLIIYTIDNSVTLSWLCTGSSCIYLVVLTTKHFSEYDKYIWYGKYMTNIYWWVNHKLFFLKLYKIGFKPNFNWHFYAFYFSSRSSPGKEGKFFMVQWLHKISFREVQYV